MLHICLSAVFLCLSALHTAINQRCCSALWFTLQEQPKNLDKLAKRFRRDISLVKNGVNTCFGLDGKAAVTKYNASSASLVNNLDKEFELAVKAGVTLAQAYDLYEAELRQNR